MSFSIIANIQKELIIIPHPSNSGFYHYIDVTYDKHIPFYVGKGVLHRVTHFLRYKGKNKHDRIILKHGIIRFAFECESEAHALFSEMLMIQQLRTYYHDKTLTKEEKQWASNFTLGGDGIVGYKFTEEQRKRVGDAGRGRKPWNFGLKMVFTEEHKKNIAKANLGKKRSKEHCEAIRLAKIGKPSILKGVKKTAEHRYNLSQSKKRRHLAKILLSFYEKGTLWNN
jgi:hypothetical protein